MIPVPSNPRVWLAAGVTETPSTPQLAVVLRQSLPDLATSLPFSVLRFLKTAAAF